MSAPVLELESTLTDRYQTTVPSAVRRALRLGRRDRIVYRLMDDGEVMLTRGDSNAAERDPALGPFLTLLARDMRQHPQRLSAIPPAFAERLLALTGGVSLDLDAPLDPADD